MDDEEKPLYQNKFDALDIQNDDHSSTISTGEETGVMTTDESAGTTQSHAPESPLGNEYVTNVPGQTTETLKHVGTPHDKPSEAIRPDERDGLQHSCQALEFTANSMTERCYIEEVKREIHWLRDTYVEFALCCTKTEGEITALLSKLKETRRGHKEEDVNTLKERVREYGCRCIFESGKVVVLKEAVLNISKQCKLEVAQKPVEELDAELQKLIKLTENKFQRHSEYSQQLKDYESNTNRIFVDMLKADMSIMKAAFEDFCKYCDNKDSKIETYVEDVIIQEKECGFTAERLKERGKAMKMLIHASKSYFRECFSVKGKISMLEEQMANRRANYHNNPAECSEVLMTLENELGVLKDLHKEKYEQLKNKEKEIIKKEFCKHKSFVDEIDRLNELLLSSCEQRTKLQEQLKATEKIADDFAKKFDDKNLKVNKLDAKVKETNDSLHEMKEKDRRNQEENHQLHEEIKTLRKKVEHLNRYGDDKNKIIKQLEKKLQAAESTSSKHFQDLQIQTTNTDHWHNLFQQQILNAQEFTQKFEKSQTVCRELEREKNSLVLRLSKIAGDNLTYQNPNIADLGDPKRPTKLAEVYNELYDNEWTDAFDRFGDFTDTDKVRRMLSIMKSADDHCDELYMQHTEAVRNGLTTLSINYKTKKKLETDMQRGEDDKNETTRQTIKPDTNTDATREERDVLEVAKKDEEHLIARHASSTNIDNYTEGEQIANANDESVIKKSRDMSVEKKQQEEQMEDIEEYDNPKDGPARNDGKSIDQTDQEQNSGVDARENRAPLTQQDGAVKGDGKTADNDNQDQNRRMNAHSNPDPLTQLIDYEEKTEKIPFEFNDLNNTQKQAIADIGRFVQNALEKKVVEVTSKVIVEEIELPEVAEILAYVRKCVTFCWSARRHDPPVYIDFMEVKDDTLLDLNVYKPYTKKGKLVDYVVWPPIYLHKGGPMLSKGVAQGKNKN